MAVFKELFPRKKILTHDELFMKFSHQVAIDEPEKCWEWIGTKNAKGYGVFRHGNKGYPSFYQEIASRFSYLHFKGPLIKGLIICHSCDRPSCVNPDHLFQGTYLDNSRDCIAKNRHVDSERKSKIMLQVAQKGEARPLAKLKEIQIKEIRICRANGMSQQKIADKFGVCRGVIVRILKGKSWRHVK